jgi:lysophospholipase L1-like esterase
MNHAALRPLMLLLLLAGCAGPRGVPRAASVTPAPNPDRAERIVELEQRGREAAGRQRPAPLVFLGDSITEAWETDGKAAWARRYAPLGAVELGIGGDQTQHVLWRLREGHLDGLRPRVLVLMIGTNNTGNGHQRPEDIRDGVAAILAELRERMPRTRVLMLAIFPRGATADSPERLNNEAANRLIEPLCDGRHVRWVDIGTAFTETDGSLAADVMPDALHLTSAGYERWAAAMAPALAELMAEASLR